MNERELEMIFSRRRGEPLDRFDTLRNDINSSFDTLRNDIDSSMLDIAESMNYLLPESREKSLCVTKLQEAYLFALAAIDMYEMGEDLRLEHQH